MNKPRILLEASSPRTGLTFHLTRMAIALKRKGHSVVVISDVREELCGLSDELKSEGITHYRVRGLDNYAHPISVKKLSRIMNAEEFDIIHISGLVKFAKSYLAKLLAGRRNEPVILHIDSIRDESAIRKFAYNTFSPILNSHAVVVPVSHWTKKRLRKYRVREEAMTVVHNAIDLELFDSVANKPWSGLDFLDEVKEKTVVAQVSNIYPWKGHKYLIMAAQKILVTNPNVHFLIVGEGPLKQELESIVYNMGISENVTFTGHISHCHIPWLLSNIDIGVLASLRENLPRTLLEYMAAQKPLVATNVGGISEAVISGVNGYLVPPRDPDSLANQILNLMNDPDNAKQMGVKGRKLVEQRFSMEVLTNRLDDVYELALRRK
jgi:glycosyltransferase involved in cell wall biosynthesis